MFEWLKYRWRLGKLIKECERVERIYSKAISNAKDEEKDSIRSEAGSALEPINVKINCLKSGRLCNIANRLTVPIPEIQNKTFWESSYYTSSYYLTTEGINEVRKRIRQERKDCCDLMLPWITAIVGILGALIGLVAVFKS